MSERVGKRRHIATLLYFIWRGLASNLLSLVLIGQNSVRYDNRVLDPRLTRRETTVRSYLLTRLQPC
jgi:hypothetical protein